MNQIVGSVDSASKHENTGLKFLFRHFEFSIATAGIAGKDGEATQANSCKNRVSRVMRRSTKAGALFADVS